MSGNHIEVQRLLSNGANVNEQVGWEGTPLHVAIQYCHDGVDCGHVEVARILLANGGDFRLQKRWDGAPLHCAARKGFTNFAHLLLSHGADINCKDFFRRTPLHDAVSGNHPHMVKFLISKGADVNAVADFELPQHVCVPIDDKSWGLTPLQIAAREGSLEIARLLVDSGASIDLKNRDVEYIELQGLTAFDLAFRSRKESHQRYEALLRLVAFRTPEQIEKYKNDLEERFGKIAAMGVNIGDYPKVAWKQEPLEELRRKEVEEPYAMLLKLVEAEVQRT